MFRGFGVAPPLLGCALCLATSAAEVVRVENYLLAESDTYLSKYVNGGAFGKFLHTREVTNVDPSPSSAPTHNQSVIRMNRDTLYSEVVLDLTRPAFVTYPDVGDRFISLMCGSESHDIFPAVYEPGRYLITENDCGCEPPCSANKDGHLCMAVGTPKAFVILRTLADANNASDMTAAHQAQDGFVVELANVGKWDVPDWNQSDLTAIRDQLLALKATSKEPPVFGFFTGPEKIDHLFGILNVAAGWGGARAQDQTYFFWVAQGESDTLTLKMPADLPLERLGFWSVTVYNKEGFMFALPSNYNSAVEGPHGLNPDGSTTVYFGGCDDPARQKPSPAHCLEIKPGWNTIVRVFRPGKAILDGSWVPPNPLADV
mmetsp:Transcript_78870/g.255822  ORF Transcript_78870/g.255822 Transcript_78870/m.255822 type:complete len:373 (+) Transcript_78870:132-1250(+)